jgi:hypothetical protein
MSSTGSTMPRPKKWAQTRLEMLGANSGLSVEVSHFGQRFAAIAARQIGFDTSEELRLHRATADQMADFAATAVEDDRFSIILALLAADLREERGEAVVIVHRPAIERMVVALGDWCGYP